MTAAELSAFLGRSGYRSNVAAAAALGVTPKTLGLYLNGKRSVPRTVELACKGLALERMLELVA